MMHKTDSYFSIGKTHLVCEDYAKTGLIKEDGTADAPERPFAIVSDGCSGSDDTDFGSRLLTVSAIHSLNMFDTIRPEWVIWRALDRVSFPLLTGCLDATLLSAHVNQQGKVSAFVAGDGVIVARTREGRVDTWEIDDKGAPGYLSYLLAQGRMHKWLAEGFGNRTVKFTSSDPEHTLEDEIIPVALVEGGGVADFYWTMEFDPAEYELVMVLSDGAMSFSDANQRPVPLKEIVPHLVDIRVPKGEFLVRSHKFFLNKTCVKNGWHHNDDFGAAAILLDAPGGTK